MATHLWFFFALGAAILWGMSYVIAEKIMHGGITPLQMFALESLISLPFVLILAELYGGGVREGAALVLQNKTLLVYFLLCAGLFIAANTFIFSSIAHKNATLSSIIEISYPLFTILFAWLLFRDFHLTLATGVGAFMILGGTMIILVKS